MGQTSEDGERIGSIDGGASAGHKATGAILYNVAGCRCGTDPTHFGGAGSYVAGGNFGDTGAVGYILNHNIVEEAVVVVESIPEGNVTSGVADAVERIGNIDVGRSGVNVGTDKSVDRMDGGDRCGGIIHNTHDESHVVATLNKVETDLQLVERGIHFGQDDIGTVVEKEQLVGVALQVDNGGVGISRAEVGAAGVPAVAAEETALVLEVLGVGQCHRSADSFDTSGTSEDVAIAVEADADCVAIPIHQARDAASTGGVGGIEHNPVGGIFAEI